MNLAVVDCEFVWKNGAIVPWEEATVHVSCHGLHYGTGVFEGIRCYSTEHGSAVFRLGAHLDRFFASARVYGLEWRYTRQDLARAVLQVIRVNDFRDCYVRPIAFYGSQSLSINPRGCPVEIVIFGLPWGAHMGRDSLERGMHVTVSRWRKFSSEAIPATAKACGQYLNSVLAIREAAAGGFDEAILLGDGGSVTEGSGENLFVVRDGHLYTNDERSSILLGIMRDSVIHLANDLHFPVHIRQLELDDLLTADEAFFTGTAAEIRPITAVDGQQISSGERGPITSKLQEIFFDAACGRNLRYLDWLTYASWFKEDVATPPEG